MTDHKSPYDERARKFPSLYEERERKGARVMEILSPVPRLKPEFKKIWVEALRTTTMAQTRSVLYRLTESQTTFSQPECVGQCCLGVFIEAAIDKKLVLNLERTVQVNGLRGSDIMAYNGSTGTLPTTFLRQAFGDDVYLDATAEHCVLDCGPLFSVKIKTKFGDEYVDESVTLTSCNDDLRLTFSQIADLVDYFL